MIQYNITVAVIVLLLVTKYSNYMMKYNKKLLDLDFKASTSYTQ